MKNGGDSEIQTREHWTRRKSGSEVSTLPLFVTWFAWRTQARFLVWDQMIKSEWVPKKGELPENI